jgi:hypothetical protein
LKEDQQGMAIKEISIGHYLKSFCRSFRSCPAKDGLEGKLPQAAESGSSTGGMRNKTPFLFIVNQKGTHSRSAGPTRNTSGGGCATKKGRPPAKEGGQEKTKLTLHYTSSQESENRVWPRMTLAVLT